MANEIANAVQEATKMYENAFSETKSQFETATAQGQAFMDKNMTEAKEQYAKAFETFVKNQEAAQVAANEAFEKVLTLQAQNMAFATEMAEKMQAALVKETEATFKMTELYLAQMQANTDKFTKLAIGFFKLN